jgi:hypothetical protein
LDDIALLKGGPMLNTATTRIYWKYDIKKSTEFLKFEVFKPFPGLQSGSNGGLYLKVTRIKKRKQALPFKPYHSCDLTHMKAQNWKELVMSICPIILIRTFFKTKLAVGHLI